jgi:1-deoxy-D-xylulose-5-phosphate synthase
MKLLDSIHSPADLKKLPVSSLDALAAEIRSTILDAVSKHGGHLAPSLGAVELAIALHYCYSTPNDKIVWDVGHQAYAHKMLTGRADLFSTLRQYEGISGFPRVGESPHDAVSVGHASTSISAALGLAVGRDLRKEKHAVVAVIGDGSLSGGLAFEGLNNLGSLSTDMVVVLNDNKMSISKNVGALSRYLMRVLTDKRYNKIKGEIWDITGNMATVGQRLRTLVRSIDDSIKHMVIPGKLFEDLGLRYYGPVDGHNLTELTNMFNFVKTSTTGPVLVHVITTKGKGYTFAENNATKYHGVGKFSLTTGNSVSAPSASPSFSTVFGDTLVELARKRDDIVAITAAMPDGTGLSGFAKEFPARFFDVGIAEGHAVTFAAGLALTGQKPVVALYSTFLQRAYDHIMHDVALDNLNVTFCIDRAGIVGEDGPTHHGMFDCSYLRTVPNALIMAPRNTSELRHMLFTAMNYTKGPVFIRYPRGGSADALTNDELHDIPLYVPEKIRDGKDTVIVALGDTCATALEACPALEAQGISPAVINARFVKPLDEQFYKQLFADYKNIITIESNTLVGGFGSAVLELAASETPIPRILRIGYPDIMIPHGDNPSLLRDIGMDTNGIVKQITTFIQQ